MIFTLEQPFGLIIACNMNELNFGQLMDIYEESNGLGTGSRLDAEQEFYGFLRDIFYKTKGSFYGILTENDQYVSALRIEPFQDGLLLAGLETHPLKRRKGYGKMLVLAVLEYLKNTPYSAIYSHIKNNNHASVKLHVSCGFWKCFDHGVMIDGSYLPDHDTYKIEINQVRSL